MNRQRTTAPVSYQYPPASLFVENPGRFFLWILLFLGLLMRQEDLAVFALVLLLLSFGAGVWSRLCADGVIIGFRVGRQRLMHGEATTVELLLDHPRTLVSAGPHLRLGGV